ncbi:MAG: serine/threonine protein kinase [Bacteroidales bacterium]|nr:serine/threonine protein kinase [Bacteroidales bacterium]
MSEPVSETLREVSPSTESYSILSLLKEGTHSRVFLAQKAGKRFVLKAPVGDGGRNLELLRREWELSMGLSHPGLAYVFTWEEDSPVGPCLVQEWVDGRSLQAYLKEKTTLSARRRIFKELLQVCSYLHRKGVLHNDLSPANILITRADDAVKIIDLGYADDDMHAVGKALGGTRGYASPELLAGDPVDARSDIYSLGALLLDIFPGRYARIACRCLRENPSRRYASVEALERALRGYWRPLWVALAAAFAIGLGLFVYSYLDTRERLDDITRTDAERQAAYDAISNELDSLKRTEQDREVILSAAKARVDDWYANEVPVFQSALKRAVTQDDVYKAWSDFCERISILNGLPADLPEPIRPAVRDYLLQRNNETFPALHEEMISRINEL